MTIIDVTEKSDPVQLSRTTYSGVAYTHQGWLTEDHNAFLFGDEEDEDDVGKRTTTYVLKVEDLERPVLVGSRESFKKAVDHNMYTLGNYVYQANYNAGLQVLEIGDVANTADLTEIAFFDMFPESDDDDGGYAGAWSNYPYFPSGNVIVSSIDRGLFVLSVNRTGTPVEPPDDPCYAESNRCSSFLGLRKGVMMHRRRLGLFCQRRCVPESRVDYRLEVSGWQCGRRCE